MNPTIDQKYVKKTLNGDTNAFGFLVEKYQDFVFTIAVRMLKSKEEAEEVAQDTFIKAFESLANYRGEAKFSSWLYTIVYRKSLDLLRKNKKYRGIELIEDITEGTVESIDNALQFLQDEERKKVIQECIAKLSESEAAIITFYYFEELSVREISAITDLSEENIKVKLFRSRKKLFTLLGHFILPEITNINGRAI